MPESFDHTAQLAGLLDLMRAGDSSARRRIIEHVCRRLQGLTRKMLRHYPRVHRWTETDDVFVDAVTRLDRALQTVQPESPRHFYNLAGTQIRRVLIDLARCYSGPAGLGRHHDTAARSADGDVATSAEPRDSSGEPASLAEWTEFHAQVEALPDAEREVFQLVWYQGLTQEQAAEILGVTARTVRRRWQDARYRLCKARLGEPLPED